MKHAVKPRPTSSGLFQPIGLGLLVWRESTRNHHLAALDDCAKIEVVRHPSWKRLGIEKPWRIVLFGNPHNGLPTFERLEDAKYLAEREAIDRIGQMADRMGWRKI